MAENNPQMRPSSRDKAPDPASAYERAKPEKESGMGRLDNNDAVPAESPDRVHQAVKNKQPLRQINAHDVVDDVAQQPADGKSIDRNR